MKKKSKNQPSKTKKITVISIGVLLIAAVVAASVWYITPKISNQVREDRIRAIYSSLNLGDEYILQDESIFGEKKIYEWDSSRSYSSWRTYIRAANVDQTVADLSRAITDAGFTYFEEPYPGSTYTQLHYKSDKNEYIRLTVSSKLRDDAFQNSILMSKEISEELFEIDPNAGPSNITIKVNLDDNNE